MKKPISWRKGQTIFNFLQWLQAKKGIDNAQSVAMADPFHLSDEEWDTLYDEFLKSVGAK